VQNLRTVHMRVRICVQLSYTTQHKTVQIIYLPNLQTIITARMRSVRGEGKRMQRC